MKVGKMQVHSLQFGGSLAWAGVGARRQPLLQEIERDLYHRHRVPALLSVTTMF